jgi:cytochrome P450
MYLLAAHPAVQDKNCEAAQLRPERWIAEGGPAEQLTTPGHDSLRCGPQYCPGRHLAMLEIKMVAAMLCKNFDVVRITDGPPVEEWFSVTMMPRNLLVTLRPRRSARTAA